MPLLDRFDICTETIPLRFRELDTNSGQSQESSEIIGKRIAHVHKVQRERYRKDEFSLNSALSPKEITKYCRMSKEAEEYLEAIFEKMEFSARAYHKILKVGRTIADMEGSLFIEKPHIAEASCYRSVDKKYWGMEEL